MNQSFLLVVLLLTIVFVQDTASQYLGYYPYYNNYYGGYGSYYGNYYPYSYGGYGYNSYYPYLYGKK